MPSPPKKSALIADRKYFKTYAQGIIITAKHALPTPGKPAMICAVVIDPHIALWGKQWLEHNGINTLMAAGRTVQHGALTLTLNILHRSLLLHLDQNQTDTPQQGMQQQTHVVLSLCSS